MHLRHVVAGRIPLKGKLDVQVLGNGRVHDAACQDVGEATVIARAPEVTQESFYSLFWPHFWTIDIPKNYSSKGNGDRN